MSCFRHLQCAFPCAVSIINVETRCARMHSRPSDYRDLQDCRLLDYQVLLEQEIAASDWCPLYEPWRRVAGCTCCDLAGRTLCFKAVLAAQAAESVMEQPATPEDLWRTILLKGLDAPTDSSPHNICGDIRASASWQLQTPMPCCHAMRRYERVMPTNTTLISSTCSLPRSAVTRVTWCVQAK